MKKNIFIIGAGPLPNEKEGIREAAGLRTEQFIRPLQQAGHNITLVLITNKSPNQTHGESDGIEFIRIHRHERQLMSKVKKHVSISSPDLCIGINTFPAFVMAKCLPKNCPFWADLNGWIMAEAQARSWSENSNDIFANAWQQERYILSKADKISTVSTAQKFCIIGEMASIGALKKENFLEEKVLSIPNSTKIFYVDKVDISVANDTCSQNLFREKRTPKDAFIIAWIGGYNNWVDEKTLFEGIETAMSTNKNIYFVSTGGAIRNIANDTFGRFRQMIDNSVYKEKFIFLGWIDTLDMSKVYTESDIGINVDYNCIETQTGARNRLNEMMKFGMPIVTTGGSEIAETIGKEKAGITVKNGDATLLSDAISTMANMSKQELQDYGEQGKHLSTEVFTDEKTLATLLKYAQNPIKTQSTLLPINSSLFFIKNALWYIKKNPWNVVLGKIWQRIF